MNVSEYLGVNKIGRNIRKSPPIQPYVPQPHVYNVHKNDFRSIVQQLTGSPSHHAQQPPPPTPPIPPSNRFQRANLAPIDIKRPQMPIQIPPSGSAYNPASYGQQPLKAIVPPPMNTTADSPISAYMRYLQHSITHSSTPLAHPFPSPQMLPQPLPFPSPRMTGPSLPSPKMNLSTPSGYINLLSPPSPYPLFSLGYQHFMPLNLTFSFLPVAQSRVFGPGPPSPSICFPSPGFFNLSSPGWRN